MLEKLSSTIKNVLAIIIYGCIWGLLEFTLGGFLHSIHYPLTGHIMTSIGYVILSAYVIRHKTFWHPIFIGCIAASFKFLNVFIYGKPIFSQGIINPALSIIKESAIVCIVTLVALKTAQLKPVKDLINRLSHKTN